MELVGMCVVNIQEKNGVPLVVGQEGGSLCAEYKLWRVCLKGTFSFFLRKVPTFSSQGIVMS